MATPSRGRTPRKGAERAPIYDFGTGRAVVRYYHGRVQAAQRVGFAFATEFTHMATPVLNAIFFKIPSITETAS